MKMTMVNSGLKGSPRQAGFRYSGHAWAVLRWGFCHVRWWKRSTSSHQGEKPTGLIHALSLAYSELGHWHGMQSTSSPEHGRSDRGGGETESRLRLSLEQLDHKDKNYNCWCWRRDCDPQKSQAPDRSCKYTSRHSKVYILHWSNLHLFLPF